jgi:ankyrin repeat protein
MRSMTIVRAAVILAVLAGIGLGAWGFFQGEPERDMVNAARAGDLAKVTRLLERDPALVRTKVYPQAFERVSQRRDYESRYGRSPWEGRYLIHDAVDGGTDPRLMLELLAAAGADLRVRLKGRTLLHDAARNGNVQVATWLIDHGADVNATNDCTDNCVEHGWTPLHDAQRFRATEMSQLLLARGANIDATSANGRSALHVAAATGSLEGAFVLCRHGADPALKDTGGRTSHELSLAPVPPPDVAYVKPVDPAELSNWLKVDGGCAKVAAIAMRTGAPVPEDDARRVFSEYACARGVKDACAAK